MTAVRPTKVKPGINFALLVRFILDKCANVREATKALKSARHIIANNYLIADREGNMDVVEACSDRVRVRKPEEDKFIVCTNHFVHLDMHNMENRGERPPDSVQRYVAIREKLQQLNGKISIEDAQKILSDHKGLVCSHIEDIKLGTLWSIFATLNKPLIYMAEGHPCKATYKLDTRLNKYLQKHR